MKARQYARLLGLAIAFSAAVAQAKDALPHWVSAWGTAQLVADGDNALPDASWHDTSLRQVVRLSLPARALRVRISNVLGTAPLMLETAAIGLAVRAGAPDLQPGTARPLRFNGEAGVMVPAGGEYLSDPVELGADVGADLAVSMHFLGAPARQTGHPGSHANSFVVAGDQVMGEHWEGAQAVEHWYQLADVEVQAEPGVGVLAAIGDSITDGHGVKADANTRWTDFLFKRMRHERFPAMGIVNTGIGGGRLLREGWGPSLVARFDRDVLTRAGVTHAVVMIGVNDLGVLHRGGDETPQLRARLVADLKLGYKQLAERAHAKGICLIGATITPYMGSDYYKPAAANEADRQELNAWIRTSGTFDAVADFDAATRDPAHPERLAPWADFGDALHPGADGQHAMADAVPLDALRGCKWKTP
jgi:lysophospholipase L1-like esterase